MENSPSVKSVAYPFGFMLALYSILVLVLIYVFNIESQNWVIGVLNALVTILIFVMAITTYKKKNNGFISLKQALKAGLATAAIGGIIAAIYTYLHYSFVYPEFMDVVAEQAQLDAAERGMTEAQQEQAAEFSKMFTSPWLYATMTLISSLFFGFIISLITGLIIKRENPAYN